MEGEKKNSLVAKFSKSIKAGEADVLLPNSCFQVLLTRWEKKPLSSSPPSPVSLAGCVGKSV